jgi:four helix bundle protein
MVTGYTLVFVNDSLTLILFRIADFGFEDLDYRMTKEELKIRTKQFALNIIKLVECLPNTETGHKIGNQIIRSGTSVAANYRAACRARSNADFISKIAILEEECDETQFWLELIIEANLVRNENLRIMLKEAHELTAIFTASGRTAKQNNPKSTIRNSK